MEKPKEILAIEKFYGIKLTENYSRNRIYEKEYKLNEKNQIINLNLSNCNIYDLSPIRALKQLTELYLEYNIISDLTPIKGLTSLKNIHLSHNKIYNIFEFEFIFFRPNLYIEAYDNPFIENYKVETKNYSNNYEVIVAKINELRKKPKEILEIEKYYGVLLSEYRNLNDELRNSYYLNEDGEVIEILLMDNKINDLSPLKELKKISYLNLSHNQISDLSLIAGLTSLKHLNISNNQISDISFLNKLNSLSILELGNNQVSDIKNLKGLKNLHLLDLFNNKIYDLSQFQFIISLKTNKLKLYVDKNPFLAKYKFSINKSSNHYDAIVNELLKQKELKLNKTFNYILPAKVLLLGNTQSGKSTMMDYLLQENEPRVIREIKDSTHILSIETLPKELKKDELPKAVFYDFGGQDYYHGLYRAFLNNGALSIIFWNSKNDKNQIREDDRNHKTLTRDFNRDYWLNQLKFSEDRENKTKKYSTEVLKNNTILMVQTHADLGHKRTTYNGDCEDMHIENEFFVALNQKTIENSSTQKMSLDYFEASLLEQINLKQETVKETLWYKELIDYIQSRKGKQTTTLKTIEKYYNREADPDKKLLPEVLRVLALSGMIMYYKDDNDLKDVAWLDPTATIKDIHDTILSKKQLGGTKGIIKKETFEKNEERIIKLLRNQKVIFLDPNPEDNNYIIPGYLPLTSEDSKMYDLLVFDLVEPNFVIKFKYFIPFGLINQLICHYGNNPDKKHYWRDQLIFTKDHCKVLIQLDFSNLEISVSIKSAEAKKSLDQIEREIFEDILDLYYDRKIFRYDAIDYIIDEETRKTMTEKFGENYPKAFENEIKELKKYYKSPDDMYISVDNKTFVQHQTLEDNKRTSTKITAYGFDEKTEQQNHKDIKIRTINELKTREQSSGLYKNFTKNENIKSVKKIFISYSKKDFVLVNTFLDHLASLKLDGKIAAWYCSELEAGSDWDDKIQKNFNDSDIICFMVSSNFMKTAYIQDVEIKKAFERKESDANFKIVPIILDFCNWKTNKNNLGTFTALPYTGKPIKDFFNENMAWYIIVECLRILIDKNEQPQNDDYFFELSSDGVYQNNELRNIFERIITKKVDKNGI